MITALFPLHINLFPPRLQDGCSIQSAGVWTSHVSCYLRMDLDNFSLDLNLHGVELKPMSYVQLKVGTVLGSHSFDPFSIF